MGKTGSGSGRLLSKTGRLGSGRSRDKVCCFDSKLEWLKVCLKFEDDFFCGLLQWWDFLIVSLKVNTEYYKSLNLPLNKAVNAFSFIDNHASMLLVL